MVDSASRAEIVVSSISSASCERDVTSHCTASQRWMWIHDAKTPGCLRISEASYASSSGPYWTGHRAISTSGSLWGHTVLVFRRPGSPGSVTSLSAPVSSDTLGSSGLQTSDQTATNKCRAIINPGTYHLEQCKHRLVHCQSSVESKAGGPVLARTPVPVEPTGPWIPCTPWMP